MNRQAWQQIVTEARKGNEALFNSAVSSNFKEHFYTAIKKMVQDEVLAREIYNSTMLKFWERFILQHEDLPESNIDGYIFQMSRNAFYEISRQKQLKRNLKIVSLESQDIVSTYSSHFIEEEITYETNVGKEPPKKIQILQQIIATMDTMCQQIIRHNILEQTPLKQVKEDIAMYGSYNAIVQKKKRCINTLKKRFQKAMTEKHFRLQTKP